MAKLPFPTICFNLISLMSPCLFLPDLLAIIPILGVERHQYSLWPQTIPKKKYVFRSCMFCLVETKRSFENGFFRQSFWVILAPTWIFQSGFGLTRCYSCFFLQSSSDVTERKHFPATWSQYNFTPVCSIFPKLKRKLKPVCLCFSRCQCTGYSLQFCSLSQLQQMK